MPGCAFYKYILLQNILMRRELDQEKKKTNKKTYVILSLVHIVSTFLASFTFVPVKVAYVIMLGAGNQSPHPLLCPQQRNSAFKSDLL